MLTNRYFLLLLCSSSLLLTVAVSAQEGDDSVEADAAAGTDSNAEDAEDTDVESDGSAEATEEGSGEGSGDLDVPSMEPTHEVHYTVLGGGGYWLSHGNLADTGSGSFMVVSNFGIELSTASSITAGIGYGARFGGSLVNEEGAAISSPELGTRHLLTVELGYRARFGANPEMGFHLGAGFMGIVEIGAQEAGFALDGVQGVAFYQEFSPAVYVDAFVPVADLDGARLLLGFRFIQELAATMAVTGDNDGRVFLNPGDGVRGRFWYSGANLMLGAEF